MTLTDPAQTRMPAEHGDTPGVTLTAAQASRFWNLGLETSREMLEALVEARVLRRMADGRYLLLWNTAR